MNRNSDHWRLNANAGDGWLGIAILLMIPGLNVIGVYMLIKQAGKLFRLRKNYMNFIYLFATLIMFGNLGVLLRRAWILLPLTIVAVAFISLASVTRSRQSKYDSYIACIGDSASYPLDSLMSEMGVSEKQLREDIASMKKRELLSKRVYIDEGRRLLILKKSGRPEPEQPEQKPKQQAASQKTYRAAGSEYDEVLLEIRALNIAIDDESVSEKIERIEQVTANIFHLVEQKPERRKDIQTFMEYYLPTTLKLLRQYARLEQQPTHGENITSSKERIESILDKLVAGFEKQLDILFKSDAVDITSDIKVLEKMMEMDGLSDK